MKDKKILLCVCGGIAAYKAIDLTSSLKKRGASIKTILSDAAGKFVGEISFSAISGESVHTSLWEDQDPIPHINLPAWADLIVVAPATANMIAKAAHGIADDLISSSLLASTKPILWVPAMNVFMYENPATQDNIALLKSRGHLFLEPQTGYLACGYEGKGKYPPNLEVIAAIETYLEYTPDLIGKNILISGGACSEALDPMRMITNRSSGKMGVALARAASLRGASVVFVYANLSVSIPYHLDKAVQANSAEEMRNAMLANSEWADVIIMCAAVSDYKPRSISEHKIKKGEDMMLELVQTPDILLELGRIKRDGQILIGFAAESQDIEANGRLKLEKKKLDLLIANSLDHAGKDDNDVYLIDKSGSIALKGDKFQLAHKIMDRLA